jgi:hypothetical protein
VSGEGPRNHGKCEYLATLTGLLGRARPELRPDIRSTPFKSYLIFFRYLPSENRDLLEGAGHARSLSKCLARMQLRIAGVP